jgi:hypothetical protein
LKNYTFVGVDQVAKTVNLPTTSDAPENQCVVMQNFGTYVGDPYFDPANQQGFEYSVGTPMLCIGLQSIVTRFLDVDSQHISSPMAGVTAGTFLTIQTDGTLATAGAAPASGIYFLVTEVMTGALAKPFSPTSPNGGWVRVQILMA